MGKRTTNTLFMLMSLDGKISTGSVDDRDFDKDLSGVIGVKEGLRQYYDLEQKTDLCSFNTGRVMAKVGWNEENTSISELPVTFVIVDNKPHLTERGVKNLLAHTRALIVITTNSGHPAHNIDDPKLEIKSFQDNIDFAKLFSELSKDGIDRVTIQSGGEMNALLLREGLIDGLSIVIAPILVGGKDTATLVDGKSLKTLDDLQKMRPLLLEATDILDGSFLHLRYKVQN